MAKILKYKGAFYDLDGMSEADKEVLKEQIAEQFPESKKDKTPDKEVKKYKTSFE